MARNRMIQADDCTREAYANCSRDARYLFDRMACFCDDGGVHRDSAKSLKMAIFPGDEDLTTADVERMLCELVSQGLVGRYVAKGEQWLHVVDWSKRQRVDRPTYRHPQPSEADNLGEVLPTPQVDVSDTSSTPRRGLVECSSSARPELKGIERNEYNTPLPPKGDSAESDPPKPQEPESAEAAELVEAWNAIPGVLPVSKLTAKRQRSLRARLAEPHFREHWRTGLQIVGRSEFCRGLVARTDGRSDKPWQADLEWFLKPDSLVRLLEGKYGGQPSPQGSSIPPGIPPTGEPRPVPRLTAADVADAAAFDGWISQQEAFDRSPQSRQELHSLRLSVVEFDSGAEAAAQIASRLRNRLNGAPDPCPPSAEHRQQAFREMAALKAERASSVAPASSERGPIGGAA